MKSRPSATTTPLDLIFRFGNMTTEELADYIAERGGSGNLTYFEKVAVDQVRGSVGGENADKYANSLIDRTSGKAKAPNTSSAVRRYRSIK